MLTTTTTPNTPNNGGSALRQVLEVVALLGIAVSVFRTFAAEGYMISTGSMAPTLLGYHKQVTCPDCGFEFAFGISVNEKTGKQKSPGYAQCPHCGLGPIDVKQLPPIEGDQLLVHKNTFDLRDPRRWEVVIFRNPRNLSQAYVKRVVGLPGETVLLEDGNVIINGKRVSKSWPVHKATRIPVFDSESPISTEFDRKMGEWTFDESNGWSSAGNGFQFEPSKATQGELSYRHREVAADLESHQVTDRYGYNSLSGYRSRYIVDELSLSCQFQSETLTGQIEFELVGPHQRFICRLEMKTGELSLLNSQHKVLQSTVIRNLHSDRPMTVDFSSVDGRVFVAIDDDLKIEHEISEARKEDEERSQRPVKIRCEEAELKILRLQVFRDLYYTPKDTSLRSSRELVKLGNDEFFVLGDNSPNSIDSRNWPVDSVKRNLLIGKPLVVHLPSRPGRIHWVGADYHIRMPDISRIRLIH